MLLDAEERRVITEEAAEAERPLPCIPKWARTAVLAYAAKVDHANWPADRSDVRKFAQTMRRTEETLASAHDTDRVTLRWLAIAWGKRTGFVHQGLNRHDLHGREIPYWTSAMLWDLQGDKPAPPWHQRWRAILAGLLARAGIETTPITDLATTREIYRALSTARRTGDWPWEEALKTVNWMAAVGLLESSQMDDDNAEERPEPTQKAKKRRKGPPPGPRLATKVRKIPFTMENPRSMLHRQDWCEKQYGRYLSFTPLCRWGGTYKKETCLWHPLGRTHLVCACKCHHFPDGVPPVGERQHRYTIAGKTGTALLQRTISIQGHTQ